MGVVVHAPGGFPCWGLGKQSFGAFALNFRSQLVGVVSVVATSGSDRFGWWALTPLWSLEHTKGSPHFWSAPIASIDHSLDVLDCSLLVVCRPFVDLRSLESPPVVASAVRILVCGPAPTHRGTHVGDPPLFEGTNGPPTISPVLHVPMIHVL